MAADARVLLEDLLHHGAQLLGRVQSQLLAQQLAGPGVGGERLGLAAGVEERGHQLGDQLLPRRGLGDQRFEVSGELFVSSEDQHPFGALGSGGEPELAEPRAVDGGPRLAGEVHQWLRPPQARAPGRTCRSLAPGRRSDGRPAPTRRSGARRRRRRRPRGDTRCRGGRPGVGNPSRRAPCEAWRPGSAGRWRDRRACPVRAREGRSAWWPPRCREPPRPAPRAVRARHGRATAAGHPLGRPRRDREGEGPRRPPQCRADLQPSTFGAKPP